MDALVQQLRQLLSSTSALQLKLCMTCRITSSDGEADEHITCMLHKLCAHYRCKQLLQVLFLPSSKVYKLQKLQQTDPSLASTK